MMKEFGFELLVGFVLAGIFGAMVGVGATIGYFVFKILTAFY